MGFKKSRLTVESKKKAAKIPVDVKAEPMTPKTIKAVFKESTVLSKMNGHVPTTGIAKALKALK